MDTIHFELFGHSITFSWILYSVDSPYSDLFSISVKKEHPPHVTLNFDSCCWFTNLTYIEWRWISMPNICVKVSSFYSCRAKTHAHTCRRPTAVPRPQCVWSEITLDNYMLPVICLICYQSANGCWCWHCLSYSAYLLFISRHGGGNWLRPGPHTPAHTRARV